MGSVTEIGSCIGCNRRFRLSDGVCQECVSHRGRKWAEDSHRVRTDPVFALKVYRAIKNDSGRKIFEVMYGLPEGAKPCLVANDMDRVTLVMGA